MKKETKNNYRSALKKTLKKFSVEGIEEAIRYIPNTDEGKVQVEAMKDSVKAREDERKATVVDWALGLGSVAVIAITVICSHMSEKRRDANWEESQKVRDAVSKVKLVDSEKDA